MLTEPEPVIGPDPEPAPDDPELALADSVGTELIRLVRLIERGRAQYQAEYPDAVERPTYHLLVHLVLGGPSRAGAMADAVHSDPSTISRQVGQLVRLGLVERTADPQDGRATLLVATAEGIRVFQENRRRRNLQIAGVMRDWSDDDRRSLARLLGRFTSSMEHTKARPATPPDRT